MSVLKNKFSDNQVQLGIFLSISAIVLILTGILYLRDPEAYSGFFGRINPLLVVTCLIIIGCLLMQRFLSKTSLKVCTKASKSRILFIVTLPLVLFAGMMWVDTMGVFSRDLNIAFPNSLLFYPSIAYVVEIIFHVLPLGLCFFIITAVFKLRDHSTALFISIPLVALIEPVFQIMNFGMDYPVWAIIYVGVNILVINLAQLWLFVKYDFVSMYAFRLMYYLLWHIIWGVIRLQWLALPLDFT